MIHILKWSIELLSTSTLEILRKINTMAIVCNAQRFLEGVQKICSAGVSATLLQILSAALKKNYCGDSTAAVDAPVLCLCQIPLCF